MGMSKPPEKCFITNIPTVNIPSGMDRIEYQIKFFDKEYYFVFNSGHKNSDFVETNKYILQGLLANNKFPFDPRDQIFTNDKLEKIIREALIPKSPEDKLLNLINYLYSLQDYEGSRIDIYSKINHDEFLLKLYFKNHNEYYFYLSTLKAMGLIDFMDC